MNVILGPAWLQEAVRDFTSLGSFAVLGFIVIAGAGFLLISRRLGDAVFLVVAVVVGTALSNTLKQVFDRPRPDVEASTHVFTASFPSGHAALSAVVYLTLGAMLAKSTTSWPLRSYFVGLATARAPRWDLAGVSRDALSYGRHSWLVLRHLLVAHLLGGEVRHRETTIASPSRYLRVLASDEG